MSMSAIAARVAAALLTSEKGRKGVGFLLIAIFAPVILIAAILCSATSGGADHNNLAVEASFYGDQLHGFRACRVPNAHHGYAERVFLSGFGGGGSQRDYDRRQSP